MLLVPKTVFVAKEEYSKSINLFIELYFSSILTKMKKLYHFLNNLFYCLLLKVDVNKIIFSKIKMPSTPKRFLSRTFLLNDF